MQNKHVRFSCAYAYARVRTGGLVFLPFCLCLRLCRGCSHLLYLCYAYALVKTSLNHVSEITL